jgi:hypothetical protein
MINKSDALSTSASQKSKKLLAEELNLEPSGERFYSWPRQKYGLIE